MKEQNRVHILVLAVLTAATALILSGCGGAVGGVSTVSGTVADIDRNVIVGAVVTADGLQTESLASGVFRLNGVGSGWKTFRASATVDGELWVGSTAVEVLENQPTMNANIVLAPAGETTEITGIVRDDTSARVSGARVLLTTRTLYPSDDTSAFDGPYGAIVAITDSSGRYLIEDAPRGIDVTLSASKVGFRNSEIEITTSGSSMSQNFDLVPSNLQYGPDEPILVAVEAYTMPDSLVRSGDTDAYKAIKAFTSERYRKSLGKQKTTVTRAAPAGSLIEVDLYWNAIDLNDSRDVAGYGIYRGFTSDTDDMDSIDFVRDPYANFYGDTGAEITPYTNYYYAISTVDVQFLDVYNNPDPAAESVLSNSLGVAPLGQVRASFPEQGQDLSGNPTFQWIPVADADTYTVYLYDRYPTLPLDPAYDYGSDPITSWGTFPIWPRQSDPDESTVGGSQNFIAYNGPALVSGRTYYWVVLGSRVYEVDDDGYPMRSAYSYSQIRSFVR